MGIFKSYGRPCRADRSYITFIFINQPIYMNKLFITDIDVRKKRVMVRTDYNVPLDENGNITDDARIRATLPTINHLLDEEAKVIIASHLGRPEGKANPKYSLKPVARRLQGFLKERANVIMAEDCIGPKIKKQIEEMRCGDVIV